MRHALARLFADAASRRWPADTGVRQEWLAEIDYLAAQRKPGRMLAFAFGLTFARPGTAPAIGFTWRTLGTTFFLLLGPAAILIGAYLLLIALGEVLDVGDTRAIWASFATVILLAALAGRWWGRWSVVSGPFPLAGALALSVTAAMSLGSLGSLEELMAGVHVWAPGLFGVLMVVARICQRRKTGRALTAGILLWLIILDLALVVEFLPKSYFVAEHSPMYLIYALTDESFGVMNRREEFEVGDDSVGMPHALLIMGTFAIAYVMKAARQPVR